MWLLNNFTIAAFAMIPNFGIDFASDKLLTTCKRIPNFGVNIINRRFSLAILSCLGSWEFRYKIYVKFHRGKFHCELFFFNYFIFQPNIILISKWNWEHSFFNWLAYRLVFYLVIRVINHAILLDFLWNPM